MEQSTENFSDLSSSEFNSTFFDDFPRHSHELTEGSKNISNAWDSLVITYAAVWIPGKQMLCNMLFENVVDGV